MKRSHILRVPTGPRLDTRPSPPARDPPAYRTPRARATRLVPLVLPAAAADGALGHLASGVE